MGRRTERSGSLWMTGHFHLGTSAASCKTIGVLLIRGQPAMSPLRNLNLLRSVERRFLRSAVIGLKFLGDENWQFWSKRFLSKMISLSFFNNAICNDVTYPALNISQVASAPYQMESRKIFTFSHYSFVILNSFQILRFFFERQILRQLYHTR